MLVSVTSSKIYDWHPNQQVYVYSADKKCLELCRFIDLNLCTGDRTRLVEPVEENLQLCQPQERELPPNCVGQRMSLSRNLLSTGN
jgi:hypothetical protein